MSGDVPQLDMFGNAHAGAPSSPAGEDAVNRDTRRGADRSVGSAVLPAEASTIAADIPTSIRLGTSSWSFPGWAGLVYDDTYTERQLAHGGLAAYAQNPLHRTVGIDRSYYAPLESDAYATYARAVPSAFRFLVKAERLLVLPDIDAGPRGSVHNDRFLDAAYATEMVVEPIIAGLGERAGPILFQFSPVHPRRVGGPDVFAERLRDFLVALPAGPLYAVELRTPELFTTSYFQALADARAVHGYTVHGSMMTLHEQLRLLPQRGQRALVIRWMLHGRHGYNDARAAYAPFDRIVDVDEQSRNDIVQAAIDAADERRDAYVIVNNKAEGSSPLSVLALADRIDRQLAARNR